MAPEANKYDSAVYCIGASDEILDSYHGTIGNDDGVIGQHIQDPVALAAHFRHVIAVGADAERIMLSNQCLTTGGPSDVAIVDENGARRL